MKKLILLFALLAIISCSSEETAKKNIPVDSVSNGRMVGTIPAQHNVYQGLLAEYDLDKFDNLYREEFNHPDSLQLDYNNSVKGLGFYLLMQKGLAEKGTLDQKKYYLNEQMQLDGNVPDAERFYTLLSSCKELGVNQLTKIDKQYYSKSKASFEEAYSTNKEELQKRLGLLEKLHKDFQKTIIEQ